MPFMQPEITEKQSWFEIEGEMGTDYVPAWVTNYPRLHRLVTDMPVERDASSQLFSLLHSYVKDLTRNTRIDSITHLVGYGARFSAPSHFDCTEWHVFDTQEQAQAYLDECEEHNAIEDEEED